MIDYTASDKKEFTLKYGHKSSTFDYAMIYDEKKRRRGWIDIKRIKTCI